MFYFSYYGLYLYRGNLRFIRLSCVVGYNLYASNKPKKVELLDYTLLDNTKPILFRYIYI